MLAKTRVTTLLAFINTCVLEHIYKASAGFDKPIRNILAREDTLGNTLVSSLIFISRGSIKGVTSLMAKKQMLQVFGNVLPNRQQKNTVLKVKHSSLNTRLMLNRNVFGGQKLG